MKKLSILFGDKTRELQYEVYHDSNEAFDSVWTEFYEGTEIIKERKYWLFGPWIITEQPKKVFELNGVDIESTEYTKSDIRKMILRKLELLERKEEIKRGEII